MKDKLTAVLLAMFLGTFGAHRFYLGEAGPGCLYLFLGAMVFPLPLLSLMGFIEGIALLLMDDATFNARYNAFRYNVHIHVEPGQRVEIGTVSTSGQPVSAAAHREPPVAWYRQARPRTAAEREQVVLAMVLDNGGAVTPAELSLQTQLSLQQARDILDGMESQGYCRTDYDPDTGLPRYSFPDLMAIGRMDGRNEEEDPLDQSLR